MPTANLSGISLKLVDSVEAAGEFLTWLGERRPDDVVAVDTETGELPGNDRKHAFSPWHGRLRLVQVGDGMTGWAIPWERWNGVFHEAMKKYQGEIICHNVSFEYKWFEVQSDFMLPWHRTHDTMIASQIINPLQSAALKKLTSRYVDSKAAGLSQLLDQKMVENNWTWGTIPIHVKEYWAYGALDCVLTVRLWEHLKPQLERYKTVYDMEMAVRRICSRMELNGARVDVEYSQAQYDRLGMYAQSIKDWVKDRYKVNAGSTKQLIDVFQNRLGGIITERTPAGYPQLDKHQLEKFSAENAGTELAQLAQQVLAMRKASKLANTYFDNFITMQDDGILHPSIGTLAARTSRMSIREPALQTLNKGDALVRKAFIPRDEGEMLVTSDLDQVEFRLTAALSGDKNLCDLFNRCDATDGDAFTEIMQEVYADPTAKKKDPRRKLIKGYVYSCVPLDTTILTRRGWLRYDQVRVGDETIGINPETGLSEWTKVEAVHNYDEAPVYRLGNSRIGFNTTANHRWLTRSVRPSRRPISWKFRETQELTSGERQIIMAAPAPDGDLPITPDEAELIGWVLTDGFFTRSPLGGTSQSFGKKRQCRAGITQTKPENVRRLEALLSVTGMETYLSVRPTGQYHWAFRSALARDLMNRAGIESKKDFDPWALSFGLTLEARERMLEAMNLGDGTRQNHVIIVQQSDTATAELIRALAFATGHISTDRIILPDGKGWQRKPVSLITVSKPHITAQKLSMEERGKEPVWCVTTTLGTWTMRQPDGPPVVTGNSLYGAGIEKMAATAGVPYATMKEVAAAFNHRYPGIKQFSRQLEHEVMTRLRTEDEGYIITGSGRRLPVDSDKAYTATNYIIQSTAAEVFKLNLLKLDAAGLTEMMVVPVHDEIVLSVPKENLDDVKATTRQCMTTTEGWAVPLTAGVDGPFERWGDSID